MELGFDKRVVKEFNQNLENLVNNSLAHFDGLPAPMVDDNLSDVIGEIVGHRPFRSFRDIENQIDVLPRDRDVDDIIEALSRDGE